MGRTHSSEVERSVEIPVAREAARSTGGVASPFLGPALSPAGRQTVLDALGDAWARHPSQRLCQLLWNATSGGDPFQVEDGELLAALRAYGREDA